MRPTGFAPRELAILVTSVLLFLVAAGAESQSAPDVTYNEVFYPSGRFRIQAYVYKPDGDGPFAVVIYNHGSRDGREGVSVPFQYIGRMLTKAGYVVLVPERRGYGKSDGVPWRQEVNTESQLVPRLQHETDDVLAAIDYLRTLSFVDTKRIGIVGWSFGGIITMFAVSRNPAFAVAIDQVGGALSWNGSPDLRSALIGGASRATTPTLFLVAQNDRTTSSVPTLAAIFAKRGLPHLVVIYEPFPPGAPVGTLGHSVFSERGAGVWEGDVIEFLGRYLSPARTKPQQ